jgi:hypothetical protein
MVRKSVFAMTALFLGIVLVFAVIGCDTGANGGGSDGGGGLTQAQKEAAKQAALEEYAADPADFAEGVAYINQLKGWSLPSNPNTWSASQWEQYYSLIEEYGNGDGNGDDNDNGDGGDSYTSPSWPVNSEITALSGMDYSKIMALSSATTWGRVAEILEYADVNALVNAIIARLEATEGPVAGIYAYQNGNPTPLNPITASTPFNYYSGYIIVVWE